ncbi:hypothetical protein E2C01_019780 [Portunus trituberculatus]|uniref:Uncharacterized protein n=1 Tax=Portunus trituberculatus TaxID=210409 RepID=A0A5B7E1E0_PORTR|nr:hypothetical protein [Portunus trituberculatus]
MTCSRARSAAWACGTGTLEQGEGSLRHQGSEAGTVIRHCASLPHHQVKGLLELALQQSPTQRCDGQRCPNRNRDIAS